MIEAEVPKEGEEECDAVEDKRESVKRRFYEKFGDTVQDNRGTMAVYGKERV